MEALLERWGRFVARWPFLIIALWIVIVFAALHFGPSLNAVSATQNTSSLPASAPSVHAQQVYTTTFAAGQQSRHQEMDVLVLTDPRGISPQDVALAEQIAAWLQAPATRPAQLLAVSGPGAQVPVSAFESSDHQALRLILTWDTSQGNVPDGSIKAIDDYVAKQPIPPGGTLGLTGSAPIIADLNTNIFNNSSGTLGSLLGYLIILVVLGIVYRSPLAIIVPLLAVGLAFGLSVPVIAWAGAHLGVAVASFSLEYVFFVLLGAGTNYGVFLLSRYKEELRRSSEHTRAARREALGRTVGNIGESILSSAATVVVATAIMGLAQLYTLRVTGPAIAIGVVCLLLAGLSLLPALMALCGRALFWPAQPRPQTLTDTSATAHGFWARAGHLVTAHPRRVALVALLLLLPLALSTVMIDPSFDDLKALPASAPSVQAFNAYSAHFQDTAQVQVILNDLGHDVRQGRYASAIARVIAALAPVPHVTGIQAPSAANASQAFFATDGSAVVLTVSLDVDPSSQAARQAVDALTVAASQAIQHTTLSGAEVLLGGRSAQVRDEANQFGADLRLVVTLVCLAIYFILALLVRSITAPFYLLFTIALSALTAVGLTNLLYHVLLGQPLFSIVPIFAFVFLASLGEDFNILTMARIREEMQKLGNRQGIAAAIALTGGVVSSCGLVMAASFSRLVTFSVVEVAELGFTVVVGVLIDTFVVRPLLVPALATLLGRWNWVWPGSTLFKRRETMGAGAGSVSAQAVIEGTQSGEPVQA